MSASCVNYCDADADCFGFEIVNACGDFVVSLFGGIDEEPLAFAEEFAATHCGECGVRPQSTYMRRPGSDSIEGGAPAGAFLEGFAPLCMGPLRPRPVGKSLTALVTIDIPSLVSGERRAF